jgi:hypothetical protein
MLDKYVKKVIEMHKPRCVVIFFPAAVSAQNWKKDPYCDTIRGSFDVYVGANFEHWLSAIIGPLELNILGALTLTQL